MLQRFKLWNQPDTEGCKTETAPRVPLLAMSSTAESSCSAVPHITHAGGRILQVYDERFAARSWGWASVEWLEVSVLVGC